MSVKGEIYRGYSIEPNPRQHKDGRWLSNVSIFNIDAGKVEFENYSDGNLLPDKRAAIEDSIEMAKGICDALVS